MGRSARIWLAGLLLTLAGAGPALATSCTELASLALPDAKITKAELVAAGAFAPPASSLILPPGGIAVLVQIDAGLLRVTATLTPTPDSDIKIEVWMPAENWNGKFVGIGNGVWAGSIGYFQMADPVTRGYAVGATDTGHVGTGMDGGFAVGHPEKLIDFGYRAIHEMTVKAKAVVTAFYGKGSAPIVLGFVLDRRTPGPHGGLSVSQRL